MRSKVKNGLVVVGRVLRRFVRLFLSVPVRLLRLLIRLPVLFWRSLVGLARFLFRLPGRVWRGLVALARFIIRLPNRVRKGLAQGLRFLVRLPGRVRQRLLLAVRRLFLRLRERRARLVHWWRSRVFPPRTLSPRAQGFLILATVASLASLGALGIQIRRLSRSTTDRVVVTATTTTSDASFAAPSTATPLPDNLSPNLSASALLDSPFGGGGAVAFSMRRNGNADIFVRKLDDDQLLRLTYHRADDREPAWAPEGQTLAFVSHRGNNWDIYRLDLVSGALIRLTREPHYDAHPSWSPDGAFFAFESYRSGNLDIFIMAADGSEVHQLTANRAADFSPAWSPDGRHIAFVSYRDGSKDIYLYPLDTGSESAIINLTQTPDREEDAPTWSIDGSRLAFSAGRFGTETIFVTTFDWTSKYLDEAQTQMFNPGERPDWSPDGTSLIFEYRRAGQTHLIADNVIGWGAGQEVFSADVTLRSPNWRIPTVDPQILAQNRQSAPMAQASLYLEEILPTPESEPPYTIIALEDVNGGDDREFLSDRVNDSFEALRRRVREETGVDYLSTIGDSFRAIGVEPPPGQSPRNWHKAGRAFDLNQGLYERDEPLVELVREDIGFRTYWRVYLRARNQDGSMGEPLHQMPWDLKARQAGGLAAREGGELKQAVPLGYYVDFTQLAADYGWERVPANQSWRHQWADINWWQFQKPQRLSWLDAMLELYRLDQIEAVFGPLSGESQ